MVEAITSGVKGSVRKQERRRKKGERFYRRAATTLRARTLKKLTSKTTWYKTKKDEDNQRKDAGRGGRFKKDEEKTKRPKGEVKAVLFVPHTRGSKLAKELRAKEAMMEELTGF